MTIVGLTGSFGTGKSTVAAMFKGLGAAVLDADKIAHKALDKKYPTYEKIVKVFGRGILKKGGAIDRGKLGKIVFKDKKLLGRLCGIIHPFVIKYMKDEAGRIGRLYPSKTIVLDAPLLIEANLLNIVDKVVVVKTAKAAQIERCRKKTGLTAKEIRRRIDCQMPIGRKIRFSDFVINNNGTKQETKREVKKVWERIRL
ncbi:MAG: dephospho-CoA kinase [Candidatus Omnitrophica bacterium]|nr:dephospho-CoA kinase [Candidatus Omnitrophota bacterium]